ncbi:hypothetical protein L596_022835 [Steinernema carpocapsae]|uniref:Uncharacterized protein n=1 Tax=Steinernema carpocapsae TaxID=34508 RepID=A0A4U5MMW6_STECR|nr:hypothetical protein L596_022835 [Steinernema carpocapsae]
MCSYFSFSHSMGQNLYQKRGQMLKMEVNLWERKTFLRQTCKDVTKTNLVWSHGWSLTNNCKNRKPV